MSKSVIIPLLPLKTIPCWNVAVRQIYWMRFFKTNQHHHQTGCISYRSTEYHTNWNNHSFPALLMGIWMMGINFHERPDRAETSVPFGQVSAQWHIVSASLCLKTLTLGQRGHQEEFLQWKGCQGLKGSPNPWGAQESPGHGTGSWALADLWCDELKLQHSELTSHSNPRIFHSKFFTCPDESFWL